MTPRTGPRRLRLRRRLTIAFVLVAAVSAAAVATSSYLLVRQVWLTESLDRAEQDARYQLALAEQFAPLDPPRAASLLDSFARSDRSVLLVLAGTAEPSDPALAPPLPDRLRTAVAGGELAYQRQELAGRQLLVVGGRVRSTPGELYVIYPEDPIHADLAQLRNLLLAGWAAVTAAGAAVGYGLARRTLEPVGRAAAAANAMAEGLLDTRLPVRTADEFGAWAASFNQMAAALETKIVALSQAQERERRFTADVAHELRTPVAALVAEASLLREHLTELPDRLRRPAELLVADVVRLRRLVDDLMEISRLDSGQEPVRPREVDLAEVVRAILVARGWSDRIRFDAGPAAVVTVTDPRRVERVLGNLLANAIEHGGDGPVEVRLAGTGSGGVRVEIADHGPGIAAEHLPHLFDRFYQADPARSGRGSGLGLAIAAQNARLLGAELEVHSEPGRGTRAWLELPVTRLLPGGEGAVGNPAHREG